MPKVHKKITNISSTIVLRYKSSKTGKMVENVVLGHAFKTLAVHCQYSDTGWVITGWSITHLRTGMRMVANVLLKEDAIKIVHAIENDREASAVMMLKEVDHIKARIPAWVIPWLRKCQTTKKYVAPDKSIRSDPKVPVKPVVSDTTV